MRETHTIETADGTVGSILLAPDDADVLLVNAHGAGLPMDSPWMERNADALAAERIATLRFDYPYAARAKREGRRLPPNRMPALMAAHRAALESMQQLPAKIRELPLFLGGKSMGGRVATMLVADGVDCRGLVLFGYPLYPPRKPEKERSEHFDRIAVPVLFLVGTRDPLCGVEHLNAARVKLGGDSSVHVLDGGGHSFAVPKKQGRDMDEVHVELAGAVREFIDGVLDRQ